MSTSKPLSYVFRSLTEAQQIYRAQLARERLFIQTQEAIPLGTPCSLSLKIAETGGALTLSAQVIRTIDEATARAHQLGTGAGVVLAVPLIDAIKAPLRDLLTGSLRAAPPTPKPPQKKEKDSNQPSPEEIGALVSAYLEKVKEGNHYDALEIPLDASRKQIRASYMKLMKTFHPDNYFKRIDPSVELALESAYQRVVASYEVLIDTKKRDKYDISIDNYRDSTGGSSADVKRRRKELEEYRAQNAPRIRKAKDLWLSALEDEKRGDINGAISKIKLAMTFDPRNPMFPRKLSDLGS